jgi:peptidoglycan hydrolase-like amidase
MSEGKYRVRLKKNGKQEVETVCITDACDIYEAVEEVNGQINRTTGQTMTHNNSDFNSHWYSGYFSYMGDDFEVLVYNDEHHSWRIHEFISGEI